MARKKKFELNDNNLAIAYYRFSSHSQNEASIDQQRELAHAWADAHGFKIVKEYEDAAISGTTEDRPGFQQMLSEVAKIRPRVLIMWKTDRLGRDKYVLAMAKRTIRDAGCEIRLLAENIPTEGPEGVLIEGLMDAMAEYYSRQLSQNIQRGMDYNTQHALYNGHKLFGYGVDKSTKRYIVDPDTAPFVQRMFAEYAEGKAMQTICDELNAQGLRTTRGAKFGVKTMNKMLQNRAYIGEYRHGDIVVEGGMPALVDEETFDKVQRKFAENKRKGSQRARGMDENDAPRYWLTGKVYCGKCGSTLQGVSGTSGTGRTYYYYYCSAQRRKQCTLKKVRKEKLEDAVTMILRSILHDSENLMSLAVDAAAYYEKNYRDTGYLDGLEAKRREVEKSLANLVKVIESGLISETVTERLVQLEEQKSALNEAIEAENIRAALCEDEHTIKAYFEKFLHADFDNPETRDQVLEYFVDKIYLTDDGLVVTSWYSEDRTEVTWDMLYGEDGNPFVKGEAVKFDCFPFGSTIISNADKDEQQPLSAFLLAVRGESNSERGAELSKARERLCQHSAQGGTSRRSGSVFAQRIRGILRASTIYFMRTMAQAAASAFLLRITSVRRARYATAHPPARCPPRKASPAAGRTPRRSGCPQTAGRGTSCARRRLGSARGCDNPSSRRRAGHGSARSADTPDHPTTTARPPCSRARMPWHTAARQSRARAHSDRESMPCASRAAAYREQR